MAKMAPKRILIVDDNDDHLTITKARFEMENSSFIVDIVHSGEECLQVLDSGQFECIISDYEMTPGMSGIDLLQEIKSREIEVPFIVLTDHGSADVEREAYINGAEAYFTKSSGYMDFNTIVNSVRFAVEKHRLHLGAQVQTSIPNEELVAEIEADRPPTVDDLRTLLTSLPEIGFLLNPDATSITDVNEPASDFLGRSKEAIQGTPLVSLVSPDDRTKMRRMILSILSSRRMCGIISIIGALEARRFAMAGTGFAGNESFVGVLVSARPLAHS